MEVTIIDRRNFHLFQPLLYQVAAAALNPSDIAYPIRSIFRRQPNITAILLAEVTAIDLDRRVVRLDDGAEVAYEYLIIGAGATHSYFGNDEWAEVAPGLKTIEDALHIRGRILAAFEAAEREPESAERLLTFVVVGGGPTGVELGRGVDRDRSPFHGAGVPCHRSWVGPGDPRGRGGAGVAGLSRAAVGERPTSVGESGCRGSTGALVDLVDDFGVSLAGGERIEAANVLWAAGVKASTLGAGLGAERDRSGRVVVEVGSVAAWPSRSVRGR